MGLAQPPAEMADRAAKRKRAELEAEESEEGQDDWLDDAITMNESATR